ncbi:hypothetical protein, conserved [Plasmodium gonderi]|uniref:Transporter n=1 Tax=Plasmodium gonderi TaxID=77519 RepID=A0A1Y1JHE7_PLAGO|nr:hypothetical protein, conserved [Plasmodium gonderi]GAW80765.1 hypothetical protein, conserved [Plasmodium gonderi]
MDSHGKASVLGIHQTNDGLKPGKDGNEEKENNAVYRSANYENENGEHYNGGMEEYYQGEEQHYDKNFEGNSKHNKTEEVERGGDGGNGEYELEGNSKNNLNSELLRNVSNKKKKNKYEGMYKGKMEKEKTNVGEKESTPYCSFNDYEEAGGGSQNGENGEVRTNENGYNHHHNPNDENRNNRERFDSIDEEKGEKALNKDKLKKIEKKKKMMMERSKKKKKENVDDKKFSEVYNSIYENLKKKKGNKKNNDNNCDDDEKNYTNKNDFYEINYASSDNVNSISSVDDDSLFNDDVLKKYIIGQVLNIMRTSFHWAITSFLLFSLFDHFSIFYVYRLVSFLTLFFFTPISIYLVKSRSIKFFLIATNTVRLIVWGFCIPALYTIYRDEIKKYYINRFYEFLFALLLFIDNIQVNISNLIDIDNNGIDFLSKKYHLKITEKSKRKFLTLHQFFFDASFIVVNPLIIFIMYLFSCFFNETYLRDVFIYLSSFIFAVITILSLVVYTMGLEEAEKKLKKNNSKQYSTFYESQNTAEENSIEDDDDDVDGMLESGNYNKHLQGEGNKDGNDNVHENRNGNDHRNENDNVHHRDNENDFEKYYARHNNKEEKYITYNNYPNIYNDQTKKYLTERSNIDYENYDGFEHMSLKNQYKKQFYEFYDNVIRIKNDNMLLFYVCSLSYLNSVEDIMILMLIPLTSIYVSEFFYINSIFSQILIAVTLISLTKCFENVSYYSNKKNIIALKDIFIGIILSGVSLLFFFFPFLMINHLNIYSFLVFYIFCCLFYFFFSTNLKTTLSLNLQKYVRESKSDIYNFVGLFMSFVNLVFVIFTAFFLSILDNFVINYVMICFFLIVLMGLLYAWGNVTLKKDNNK